MTHSDAHLGEPFNLDLDLAQDLVLVQVLHTPHLLPVRGPVRLVLGPPPETSVDGREELDQVRVRHHDDEPEELRLFEERLAVGPRGAPDLLAPGVEQPPGGHPQRHAYRLEQDVGGGRARRGVVVERVFAEIRERLIHGRELLVLGCLRGLVPRRRVLLGRGRRRQRRRDAHPAHERALVPAGAVRRVVRRGLAPLEPLHPREPAVRAVVEPVVPWREGRWPDDVDAVEVDLVLDLERLGVLAAAADSGRQGEVRVDLGDEQGLFSPAWLDSLGSWRILVSCVSFPYAKRHDPCSHAAAGLWILITHLRSRRLNHVFLVEAAIGIAVVAVQTVVTSPPPMMRASWYLRADLFG